MDSLVFVLICKMYSKDFYNRIHLILALKSIAVQSKSAFLNNTSYTTFSKLA